MKFNTSNFHPDGINLQMTESAAPTVRQSKTNPFDNEHKMFTTVSVAFISVSTSNTWMPNPAHEEIATNKNTTGEG